MTLPELNVFKDPEANGAETLPEFADVALAEIDAKGCILNLNAFGKTVWGWEKGDKLPEFLFSSLLTGKPLSYTDRRNGGAIMGTGVKREQGWLLVGYHDRQTDAEGAESSFKTLIENVEPVDHPFIEQNPQGVLFLDRMGNVVFANHQFREILDIDLTRAVSDNALRLFRFDEDLSRKIEHLLKEGMAIEHEFDPPHSPFEDVRLTGLPVNDTHDSLLGAILTLESRRRMPDSASYLETQKIEDHPQLAPLKNVFIAMMSHEIRTPLGVMNGYAEILGQELDDYEAVTGQKLPQQIKEFVGAIHENAQRLLGIVNEMFDLSNMRQLHLSPVDVHEVLRPVIQQTERMLSEKGVAFDVDFTQRETIVLGNTARLEQVFKNLLSNAVKFTHSGSVSVKTGRQDGGVYIEVADTGIGISQDYLDQLFTPFFQEDTRLNRSFAGVGMGLAVVKLLVDLMNGRIEVESEKGRGSRFRIFLPSA